MKLLVPTVLALTLAGCSTTSTPAPYNASGTGHLEGRSASESTWTGGTTVQLTQAADGALTGTADSTDGSMTGSFQGNTSAGTFTYGVYGSGSVRIAR